jgi:glycosyltransferase involved in cell wall biosynthesis
VKIAVVNNYYYLRGGSERVLFSDQESLRAVGHDVRPFAPRDERNEEAVSQGYFPAVKECHGGRPVSQAKAAVNIIYSSAVGRAFGNFLDEFLPDVIHCHNIYGKLTTAVLDEAKRRGVPIVLTAHDQKLVCPAYLGLRHGRPCQRCIDGGYWRCLQWKCHKQSAVASLIYTVESYLNRFAGKYDAVSRFLCPSRFLQSTLVRSGIDQDRAVYHPNAVAFWNYLPSFEPGNYCLYVGRLSPEKGLMTLLEAAARNRIPLRIAGTGPLDEGVKKQIARRQLNVHMEGYRSGADLAELYRNSAFTVVPSEWYENASMSVLESFAYGKPVLASAIGGNPELVIDGKTGRLFPPAGVAALAETASEMWADRDELSEMGRNARSLIENDFSQDRRIADLIRIYEEVIAGGAH